MLARVCAVLLALGLPAGIAYSGTQLTIAAVVAKSARISVRGAPERLTLVKKDVQRGYVDFPEGMLVDIASNSREGVQLAFLVQPSGVVRAIEVDKAGESIMVPGSPRGMSRHRVEVRYRLLLTSTAQPGVYPWPVQIVATPL